MAKNKISEVEEEKTLTTQKNGVKTDKIPDKDGNLDEKPVLE